MTSPKRTLTAIRRQDDATIARLEIEEQTLYGIYERALNDWLDKRFELIEAKGESANSLELVKVIDSAERRISA